MVMGLQSSFLLAMDVNSPLLLKTQNDTVPEKKVKLISEDDKAFDVDEKVVMLSPVLRGAFDPESKKSLRETTSRTMKLATIHSTTLVHLIELLTAIKAEKVDNIVALLDKVSKKGMLADLQEKADFLLIPSWTHLYKLPDQELAVQVTSNALKAQLVRKNLEHSCDAYYLAKSDDGRFIITGVDQNEGEQQHQYFIWDMRTQKESGILLVDSPLTDFQFSPNGLQIAAIEKTDNKRNAVVHIWKTTGELMCRYAQPFVAWVQWSPDSTCLALYSYNKMEGELMRVLTAEGREVIMQKQLFHPLVVIERAAEFNLLTKGALSFMWDKIPNAIKDPQVPWIIQSTIISDAVEKSYKDYRIYLHNRSIVIVNNNVVQGRYLSEVTAFDVHQKAGFIVVGTSQGKLKVLNLNGEVVYAPTIKLCSAINSVVISNDDRFIIAADKDSIAFFTVEYALLDVLDVKPDEIDSVTLSDSANTLVVTLFNHDHQEKQVHIIDLSAPEKLSAKFNTLPPFQGYVLNKLNNAYSDGNELKLDKSTGRLFSDLTQTIASFGIGNTQAVVTELQQLVKITSKKRKRTKQQEPVEVISTSSSSTQSDAKKPRTN